MEEKVFIVGLNGQIGVTNLSFEEVSEILATAAANKNKSNANSVEVSEEELMKSIDEFCFSLLMSPKISKKIVGKDLEMKELHRKSLAFAKSKGISLTGMFTDLGNMSDDDLPSHLKAIFGVDFQ